MRFSKQIGLAAVVLSATTVSSAAAQMRHQGLDKNKDGVITRQEWRGNDQSFRNQDWNGDGILSGEELRTGARRPANWNQDWNKDGKVDNQDNQISERYKGYDLNNDGRVADSEWRGDRRLFTRVDTNHDRFLSIQEYVAGGGLGLDAQGGPANRFSSLDSSQDGWITRNEWNMGDGAFNRLDSNNDNRISRFEFDSARNDVDDNNYGGSGEQSQGNNDRFMTTDANRDGWLSRSEFRGGESVFTRLDVNRDNRLSRSEYDASGQMQNPDQNQHSAQSVVWRTGYDRGVQEGRQAGKEDYNNNQKWDLEGQTELERADSGYNPQVGSRSDYQAGYREGFRKAYREGFSR